MEDSVTICIGTIGSVTFDRCLKNVNMIAKNDSRVKGVSIIEGKRPQSEWLNEMRRQCKETAWCLQVDEDMYLDSNSLDCLMKFALKLDQEGKKILNASSLLYDLFLDQKVGSLKLWSSEPLQLLEFRDVMGGDRDIAKRAEKIGYLNYSINKVLGLHDSAPTASIAFSKYYEYTQKIIKFDSRESAKKFSKSLKRKWEKDGSYISKKAYDGSVHGLRNILVNKSKS